MKSYFTVPRFFSRANGLRSHFEDCFSDGRSTAPERFIWDFWHIKEQYRHLRTPAEDFFPEKIFQEFRHHLVRWGQQNLGCHDVSPPWLSCYVDGCYQELHGDLPHGPWAYVFSLTPWNRKSFKGGETILLKDQVLDFWKDHSIYKKGLERNQVYTVIPPRFNQLTVFDPRIPHGVRRVAGADGVTDGRLVIHGWFIQPQPFIAGPLPHSELRKFVENMVGELSIVLDENLSANGDWIRGVFTVRFTVTQNGTTRGFLALPSTLRSSDSAAEKQLLRFVNRFCDHYRFRNQKQNSVVTLPIRLE